MGFGGAIAPPIAGGPGGAAPQRPPPVGVWEAKPPATGSPGAAGSPRPDGMTYARSFICPPACFLKSRLVFQADYLLGRLPITRLTVSRHTLYNSGHPLSSIIRSSVYHAHSSPSSICPDRHRSSVCRAHGWIASHQLYQQFGISKFFCILSSFPSCT